MLMQFMIVCLYNRLTPVACTENIQYKDNVQGRYKQHLYLDMDATLSLGCKRVFDSYMVERITVTI